MENNVYVGSRGCPYQCAFCVEGNLKQKHRMRSPEKIYFDLRSLLQNTKSKLIIFGDDTFTASKTRVFEMCKIINQLRKEFDFVWFAEGRVNVLAKNPELIRTMAQAGMLVLQVGIESGSQQVLDAQNKRITVEEIKTTFAEIGKLKDLDIRITGNLILGGTAETAETLQESLEFIKELYKLSDFNAQINYSYLVPFKGTPIGDNPDKYDVTVLNDNFEMDMHQFAEIICHSKSVTHKQLSAYYSKYQTELFHFFQRNIFYFEKQKIDNRILSDRKLQRKYAIPNDMAPWTRTIYSYQTFSSYYDLFDKKFIIKDTQNVNLDMYPIRVWEIDYDFQNNYYLFDNLKNEEIIIDGNDIFLWEIADGQHTIREILQDKNSPFKNNLSQQIIELALNFYKKMYENFALVFSEI
ncbi:MAG: radical SAM protein [Prevotellaceae bacterium]|jgi:radical SAM superfamily enzyme YgiQ (UPF0313 family)|nr:radical SAM protein [Prevotellaceae bacterium]